MTYTTHIRFLKRVRRTSLIGLIACSISMGISVDNSVAQDDPVALVAKPAVEKTEAAYLSNIRQLTFDGIRAGEGYFSRDGKSMVFKASEKRTIRSTRST